MVTQKQGDPAQDTGLAAVREAPQGAGARYLLLLRPSLAEATSARASWVRFLNELASRRDLPEATPEAVQVALGQASQFAEARRQLNQLPVPPNYQDMHDAIDGWLKSLELSCQIIVRQTGPLTTETLARVREALREAASDADRFNAQRAAIQAVVKETIDPSARPRVIANRKELRVLGGAVVLLLGLIGSVTWLSGALGNQSPLIPIEPTATPPVSSATATALAFSAMGGVKRVFPLADIQKRLDAEVTARRVAYRQATVRLVPPDRLVVNGKIQGTADLLSVEVDLRLTVEDGLPKLQAQGMRAAGVDIPREAFDALSRRADEANDELAKQLAPNEMLHRVIVESNQVVAEIVPARPAPRP